MYLHEDLEKGYFTSDRKNTFMTDPLKTHNCDWLWIEIDCKVGMYLNILKSQPARQIHTSHHDLVSPSTSDAYISIFGEMHWADAGLLSDPLTTLHPRVTSWPELRP